jgi:hypothetical protein
MIAASVVTLGAWPAPGQDAAFTCPTSWSEAAPSCAWELVTVDKPFVVTAVTGKPANEGGGAWPEGVHVAIELANLRNPTRRRVARARVPSGEFKIDDVPQDEYCFRVGIRPPGWSCVEGRIVLSSAAP